jgi:hypothetical protein
MNAHEARIADVSWPPLTGAIHYRTDRGTIIDGIAGKADTAVRASAKKVEGGFAKKTCLNK